MKKILYLLLFLLAGQHVNAQFHLSIDSIAGMPQFPTDSAYEYQSYNITTRIVNNDSVPFQDAVIVLIKSITAPFVDTLYGDTTSIFIAGPGSALVTRNNYVFSPVYFDDGDNIVVVWPQARNTGSIGDSTSFHIYFISLLASVERPELKSPIYYPNPATQSIYLKNPTGIAIKRVRIFDISGKEVYHNNSMSSFISIEKWPSGLYIIDVEGDDGLHKIIKIQKN